MEIKNPKFKVGDKVTTLSKVGEVLGTISGIKYYDLQECTYIYKVKFDIDGFTEESYLDQFVLDAYIEKPKSVWDLKNGDEYYYIDMCGDVDITTFGIGGCWTDKKMIEIGNAFLTEEEAEYELERRRIENEMLRLGGRRNFKNGERNWYIYSFCDFGNKHSIGYNYDTDNNDGKIGRASCRERV